MGVGAEGEAGVVVAEDGGHGFHVYAILEGKGSEGVAEVVQVDVREASGLENFVVDGRNRIGVVHTQRLWGGEHDLKF